MRRLLAWVAGLAGGAAAYRAWRRAPKPLPAAEPDPAEALRAKLADAKAAGQDRDEFEAGERPVDEAPDPDERRRAVHERGRAALDEMRGDEPG
jgi:hypothetical protein